MDSIYETIVTYHAELEGNMSKKIVDLLQELTMEKESILGKIKILLDQYQYQNLLLQQGESCEPNLCANCQKQVAKEGNHETQMLLYPEVEVVLSSEVEVDTNGKDFVSEETVVKIEEEEEMVVKAAGWIHSLFDYDSTPATSNQEETSTSAGLQEDLSETHLRDGFGLREEYAYKCPISFPLSSKILEAGTVVENFCLANQFVDSLDASNSTQDEKVKHEQNISTRKLRVKAPTAKQTRHTPRIKGKTSARKAASAAKSQTHEGYDRYHCKICDSRFSRQFSLMRHLRIHSETPLPYKCSYCGKNFSSTYHMQRHQQRTHLSPTTQIRKS